VHSILLIRDRQSALDFPSGRIDLACCEDCGFIFNRSFDGRLQHYDEDCEETQGFSPTFASFHQELAEVVIKRFCLQGKTVLEIGCGKGEFLELLCRLGGNRGIGFDPAFRPDRLDCSDLDLRVYQEFFPEDYRLEVPDFVCCKMTLEHIPDVLAFLKRVRRALADRGDVPVFFQIPEAGRVFGQVAFWDVYYEHCSYFSKVSLARLFRRAGFEVCDLWTSYEDQYLMIDSRPALKPDQSVRSDEGSPEDMVGVARDFEKRVLSEKERWQRYLEIGQRAGLKTVLWGGGSKAVGFLTLLEQADDIQYVVDINPHRQGTYLPGVGQAIVEPGFLRQYRPDRVIVMNSIYVPEIKDMLQEMGLSPELTTVDIQP